MTEAKTTGEAREPAWRQRAVSRSLHAARSRAEQRVQRFLDAAFELIDEKGTTDFTIQEVIDRSKQSLRGFYQYFDGKDELLLALFEDSIIESATDLHDVVDAESDPLARLRAFMVRLHEWCEPADAPRRRGSHNRRPISEFSVQLAVAHPERVKAALEPISRMLLELVEASRRRRRHPRPGHPPRRRARPADGHVQLVRQPAHPRPADADHGRRDLGVLPPRPGRVTRRRGVASNQTRSRSSIRIAFPRSTL